MQSGHARDSASQINVHSDDSDEGPIVADTPEDESDTSGSNMTDSNEPSEDYDEDDDDEEEDEPEGLPPTPPSLVSPQTRVAPRATELPHEHLPYQTTVHTVNSSQFAYLLLDSKRRFSSAANSSFPWMHGIAEDNEVAPKFFELAQDPVKNSPLDLRAALTPVVCGIFEPSEYEIKGTSHVSDSLQPLYDEPGYAAHFLDVDDHTGTNIRNYRAQPVKYAECGDLLVFLPTIFNETPVDREARAQESFRIAEKLKAAQTESGSQCSTYFYAGNTQDVFRRSTPFERKVVMSRPPSTFHPLQSIMFGEQKLPGTVLVPFRPVTPDSEPVSPRTIRESPQPNTKEQGDTGTQTNVSNNYDMQRDQPPKSNNSTPTSQQRAYTRRREDGPAWDYEFPDIESQYLREMTASTEIFPNIWLGNAMDAACVLDKDPKGRSPLLDYTYMYEHGIGGIEDAGDSLLIDCSSSAVNFPSLKVSNEELDAMESDNDYEYERTVIQFPSTAPNMLWRMSTEEEAQFTTMCSLIYRRSQRTPVLIYCADGYRGSSFLILGYIIFRHDSSSEKSSLYLHEQRHRAFSIRLNEVRALLMLQETIWILSSSRRENPSLRSVPLSQVRRVDLSSEPWLNVYHARWLDNFDGSFPSRSLPYSYVGTQRHAANKEMLSALGIRRIISIGPCPFHCDDPVHFDAAGTHKWPKCEFDVHGGMWCSEGRTTDVPRMRDPGDQRTYTRLAGTPPYSRAEAAKAEGGMNYTVVPHFEFLHIDFADDGVAKSGDHSEECLDFLRESQILGINTSVHCQQGVSRSIAVCIAEIMRSNRWPLPKAYLLARVRRLDVSIQPNLRLMYELLKYEETTQTDRAMDWPLLCKQIARLNEKHLV